MPVCPKCGADVAVGMRFCSSCGAPMGPASGGASGGGPVAPSGGGQGGIASNVAAMLTYIPLCFVGLICAILFGFVLDPYKNDRFIRFHAWQSLAVHVAVIVICIGWNIFAVILAMMARGLAMLTMPIGFLLGIAGLGIMILMMLKAYGSAYYKLPVVGDWAEKQANK